METIIFMETDKTDLITEPEQWQAKVTELGLEGQQALFDVGKKPNPFTRMDAGLIRVFEVLCPTKTLIDKFSADPIPMEVLGAYGLAVHEHYFDKVEIWFSPGVGADPVMVGYIGNERYLMAQWGPERLSLDECRARAIPKWIAHTKASLEKGIVERKNALESIGSLAEIHFAGEWVHIPY